MEIPSPYGESTASWSNSEFIKLNLWNLTCFEKIVYIDADALVIDCIDELFDRECSFAACPDVFPPDKFNAGVMFLKPNESTFWDLRSKLGHLPSYDGGDTGYLNAYFSDWYKCGAESRLPFGYNAQRTVYWFTHDKQPGYWDSIRPLKIIHYCSQPKPWEISIGNVKIGDLEWLWWQKFMS